MGYGLTPYSVSIDKLVEACGSCDDALRRAICERFKDEITLVDDFLDHSNEEGISLAIKHLIMNEDQTLDGASYGYGFEFIVRFFGDRLDNNLFYPCHAEYLENEVDAMVKETGAIISLSDLCYRGAPVDFRLPDDFPFIGHWTAGEVAQSIGPFQSSSKKTGELKAVLEWLEYSASRGEGIVGFYY
jgi:hypothetical protein